MGNSLSVPILVLMAILQATLLPLMLGEIVPTLVLLFVMSWAINANTQQGVIWSFVGGVTLDLISGLPIGTSVIGLLLIAFFVSGIDLQAFRFGIFLLFPLTAIATVFQEMLVIIAVDIYQWIGLLPSDISGFNAMWGEDLIVLVLPTVVYNLIVILPVYIFVRRIQRRIGIV